MNKTNNNIEEQVQEIRGKTKNMKNKEQDEGEQMKIVQDEDENKEREN